MLDHKGIARHDVLLRPSAGILVVLGLGIESIDMSTPAAGATRVRGSRWIARALDEVVPQPPLFPAEPARRRVVEDAERWGERFQQATRRMFLCASRHDPAAFAAAVARDGYVARRGLRMIAPLALRAAAAVHQASDSAAQEDLALLAERLEEIDAWIRAGVLDGEQINAADLQIAPAVAVLLRSPDLWPYVEGRPAAALAGRVLPPCRDGGGRITVPAWLGPAGGREPDRRVRARLGEQ
ncbi:MAG TPA: hypothetical protein VGO80_23065 [Solirubrobacteraceae bacterium]|jgi:glutathione S-transferase|nr:hypothetical protein [Solirubrobacteraceae bacterium]